MIMKKVYAESSNHTEGAFYVSAYNATPQSEGRNEILVRRSGRPEENEFQRDEWALVLRGLSRRKTEAIVLILNAPED
jgi:hypothetical protein